MMSSEIKAHKEEASRQLLEQRKQVTADIQHIDDKADQVANASEVVGK